MNRKMRTRIGRAPAVPLEPQHRGALHMAGTLERMADWLSDEGWNVAVSQGAVRAERRPGPLYTGLSPVARISRGRIACWSDGAGLHLVFKPDWFSLLVDAALLALGYAITRGVAVPGSRWADAAVAFGIFALGLPTFMPLVRLRFVTVLARAVSATDNGWERIRERGHVWRFVWIAAGTAALSYWLLARWIVPFLYGLAGLNLQVARAVFPHQPLAAIKLVLIAVLAGLALVWLVFRLGRDNQTNYTNRRRD